MKNKKITGIILTILVICVILFLTLMSAENTWNLSESVRLWLKDHSIEMTSKQLRSDIHIFEYFPLGFALCWWIGIEKAFVIGTLLGLSDETLKIFLPTRHFSGIDFVKDAAGVALGAASFLLIVAIINKVTHNNNMSSMTNNKQN